MDDDKTLRKVKQFLRNGSRFRARDLLTKALKSDQNNPDYWLWMSAVVNSDKERLYCLERACELDARNDAARIGLIMMGAMTPENLKPVPPLKHDWVRDIEDLTKREERGVPFLDSRRWVTYLALGGIVLVLVLSAVFFPSKGSIFSPRLTVTPHTWTPTMDQSFGEGYLPSPTPSDRAPIGRILNATYTPTPIYVNTPHPGYGSYQTGTKAYQRGDFEAMLTYMRLTKDQLNTPDISFLLGEAYRFLGQYGRAKEQYEEAINLDPTFAPAYYGRAMVDLMRDPGARVESDLNRALEYDENFGPAYIQRAKMYLDRKEYRQALSDARAAVEHLPNSHLAHLYRARAYLELGQPQKAYVDGDIALETDINYVPTYLTMGRIYLALGDWGAALSMLGKYEEHAAEKPTEFFTSLGAAYYRAGEDVDKALNLLNESIDRDPSWVEAYLYRGLIYLDRGQNEGAIGDLSRFLDADPSHFQANLSMGKAQFQTGNFPSAVAYFTSAEEAADGDRDLASVYYWRASTYDEMSLPNSAYADWKRLVDLPVENIPEAWLQLARARLTPTATPTITMTPIASLTPTITLSPTPTGTPTITPSPTPTVAGGTPMPSSPTPSPTPTTPVHFGP